MAQSYDGVNCCPFMARLGVCLEPQACHLLHKIVTVKGTEKLSTEAKEFNPFTAQASSAASKEFNPEVRYAPASEQSTVLE